MTAAQIQKLLAHYDEANVVEVVEALQQWAEKEWLEAQMHGHRRWEVRHQRLADLFARTADELRRLPAY